jgi:hypothetical protein
MWVLKKVPRPERRAAGLILGPGEADAEILKLREVPGGGWHHVILDGKPVVVAYCPKCGKEGYLDEHEIDVDGVVTPSLVCPHAPCDFHGRVALQNYEA